MRFCNTFHADPVIKINFNWPNGMYALPAPKEGCPKYWSTGRRTQTNGDNFDWSSSIGRRIAVSFMESTITLQYCVKTRTDRDLGRGFDWPEGSYCIARKGRFCPPHFKEGSITWNDKKSFLRRKSLNRQWGELPDGEYDKNTKMYFCCRNDASASDPMMFPISEPFVLYRYGGTCQKINGTEVQEDFVKFDSMSLVNSKNECTGFYPDDDNCSEDHVLHFCHYSRAT